MQTFFRPLLMLSAVLLLALAPFAHNLSAQQLARPGWAGFHTQSETWWKHAVFYHIEPSMFQDSDGDGHGDLRGIALRMDYLQSLGVDAILLDVPANDAGFDDLLQAAAGHRIRIVVEIYGDAADTPSIARLWLTRGAAGLYVHTAAVTNVAALLAQLQTLVASFPGQRLLLSDAPSGVLTAQPQPLNLAAQPETDKDAATHPRTSSRRHRSRQHAEPAALESGKDKLISVALTGNAGDPADSLRRAIEAAEALPNGALPLLSTEDDERSANRFASAANPAQGQAANAALAALLLASRGAALLEYGQELGLKLPEDFNGNVPMAWTPADRSATKLEVAPEGPAAEPTAATSAAPAAPKPPAQVVYGEYHPYVPPKPKKPASGTAPEPVDLNALPGFTTGKLPAVLAANQATANVATEESQHDSLLHLYRRLLQLHHDNPSLLSGRQTMLSTGGQPAIAWLRRAPEGTLTASSVVVACNLSSSPIVLELGRELARIGLRGRSLHTLLDTTGSSGPRSTSELTLAPGELYLGEVTR
jgi:voltage-gated potassium channel Kch